MNKELMREYAAILMDGQTVPEDEFSMSMIGLYFSDKDQAFAKVDYRKR